MYRERYADFEGMMERYKLEMQRMYEDTAGRNLQREEQFPPPAREIQNETDTEQLYGTGEPAAEQEDRSFERFDERPERIRQRLPEMQTGMISEGEQRTVREGFYGVAPERTRRMIPETQPEMIPEGEQRIVRDGFYGVDPERTRQRIPETQPEMIPEGEQRTVRDGLYGVAPERTRQRIPETQPEIRRERIPNTVQNGFSEEIPDGIPPEKAYGEIVVSTSSGRGAYPLSGASVVIDRADKDDPAGRQELIASLPTDESGKTKSVRVSAVSREYSLEPGNGAPFSTYFVTAFHEGYIPIRKRPVDVFGGEISLLDLELIPKPEGET